MRTLILIAAVLAVYCAGDDVSSERRTSSSRGRKRSRGTPFRQELRSSAGDNVPLDPLFTDQREIRLTFTKEQLWSRGPSFDAPIRRNKPQQHQQQHHHHQQQQQHQAQQPHKKPAKDYSRVTPAKKPNIILMITDDQDVELGSLEYMPKTRAILKEGGAFFPNSFVSTPMCCPSRSSMLTGLFVHNHGVLTNNENCSSAYWQAEHEPRTFGAYLAGAGYRTGYFGKYLNKYNGSYIPPGWKEWAGQVMNSRYYNYTINFNGRKIKHGADYHMDYYPDLITNDSIKFLRQSKHQHDHQPFMLVMSFPSPHGPEDSAPQYSNMFMNVTRHRTPSYDFAPNLDKQWILRWVGKMKPVHHKFTDLLMTKRLQTLQSVDDAVERIHNELKALNQLDNTYIFYTSDHGYHLGQFGLIKGKSFPFESDIRVPFLVKGPGVGQGRVVQSLVGNVDLAPTFLEIAGVPVPAHMDGASIFRFLYKEKTVAAAAGKSSRPPWRDTYLIERGRYPPALFPKLNVVEDVPISNEGAEGDDADGVSVEYSQPRGKFERLAVECRKPQYQSPCTGFQKYECVFSDERWRMKKCRPAAAASAKRKWCKCSKAAKYRLSKLDAEERRMQRAFLKEHTDVDWRSYRPRFLKTVASASGTSGRLMRTRRDLSDTGSSGGASSVLRDVAEDELEQVELIMENISDEISDLEALRTVEGNSSTNTIGSATFPATVAPSSPPASSRDAQLQQVQSANSTGLNCQLVGQSRINCSSEVYTDPATWRTSRNYLEQQIRILRVQLDELKVIRKHLRAMRPPGAPLLVDARRRPVNNNERPKSSSKKAKHKDSKLFDWSAPPQSTAQQKTRKPSSSAVAAKESSEDDHDDEEEDDAPVETIEVTIYDNRKNDRDLCPCVDVNWRTRARSEERLARQSSRRKIKEERMKRREKKLNRKRAMAESYNGQCNHDKMNCFSHDNNHWRTAPHWTDGPFCVCMNANNNTYWCLRTLNATHNSLYCEFITGFVTYYDMRIDPYQLRNIAHTLTESELAFYHHTLEKMRICKGAAECFVNTHPASNGKLQTTRDQQQQTVKEAVYRPQHANDNSGKTKPRRDGYWRRSKRRGAARGVTSEGSDLDSNNHAESRR